MGPEGEACLSSSAALPDGAPQLGVFPRRYWMLFLLSAVSALQSAVWLTFSPIEDEVKSKYGWNTADITLLAAWGPLVYTLLVLLVPQLVQRLGLRASITAGAVLVLAATSVRCITSAAPWALLLAHLGQILNAAAGPLVLATPSKLSAEWFPPHHRHTATAVAVLANYAGSGIGFAVAFVVNSSQGVSNLLLAEAGAALVLVAFCAVDHAFFPPRPPLPPSLSATVARRTDTVAGVRKLLANPQFVLLCLANGFAEGAYSGWSGVLDPILDPLGYSQDTASWLGIASTAGVVVGGLVAGAVADRLPTLKATLVWMFVLGGAFFAWFALLANGSLPQSLALLFVSCTVGSLLLAGAGPLFYEATVESAFPVDEVTTGAVLTIMYNIVSGAFSLLTGYIAGGFMNWVLVGCCAVCTVFLLVWREEHRRSKIDEPGAVGDAAEGLLNAGCTPASSGSDAGAHTEPLLAVAAPGYGSAPSEAAESGRRASPG